MEPEYYGALLLMSLILLGALLIYLLLAKNSENRRMKREIANKFNAKNMDGQLYFTFRGYDVTVTFKPTTKVSILHNRDVTGIKPPKNAKLTPLYLIFRIKKVDELGEKLNQYIDFLESIPTR